MEFDEYSSLLSQMNLCYSKWEEVKRERDALKSNLEKANHKIEELETSLARYTAKDSAIEEERRTIISSRVIEEFVKEGPSIVKKIDKVEQNVSWLSEAVETLLSNVHKTSSSTVNANINSISEKSHEENIQIDDRGDLIIKDDENKDLLGISDIDLHVIDVNIGDVEYSSAHSDGRSNPLSTQHLVNEEEDINCIECSNIFSSSSTLFSGEGNSQNQIASMGNNTMEKNDDCQLLFTELIASSSQWFTHCNNEHSESYSLSNNEIPLPTMSTSLNVSSQSNHAITEVDHSSKEIIDYQELTIQSACSDENSSLISVTPVESDSFNTSEEIASFQNRESIIRNTKYNFENPSQISTTQLESSPNSDTSKEIITCQNMSNNSFPSSNDEFGVIVNSNEESVVIQNADNPENSSQIRATQLEPEICNISGEISSSQTKLNSSPSNNDENGLGLIVDSNKELSAPIQNTKSHKNSSFRGVHSLYKPLNIKIVIERLDDVEENLRKKVKKGEDIDNNDTKKPHEAQISSSPLHYNLRTRNKLTKNETLNSDNEGCCPSDHTNEGSNSEKSAEIIRPTPPDCKKEAVDSCSTNGRLSSMSSLKSQKSARREYKCKYNYRRTCLICKGNNPNNSDSSLQFRSPAALFKHILENHPQPNSIYIRCPYKENRCIHHFRHIERLSAHVKSFHKKKSWPCDSCDKNFTRFPDLQNHIEKEHSMPVDSSMVCEYCGYNAYSSELMNAHLLKYHIIPEVASCLESIPAVENPTEEPTDEKNDEKREVSSSHIVSSLDNQFKNLTKECEVSKKENRAEMKFQSSENLDSQHLKNRCNSFPDHFSNSNSSLSDHSYAIDISRESESKLSTETCENLSRLDVKL
ncbi:uncharacterized protein LOC135835673 [Planococcus citri]|uniref:uncharacterized protein LOC135835673 n=1 Tax=Planococcus citri TaxID=170843 RepID=UPI0031F79523